MRFVNGKSLSLGTEICFGLILWRLATEESPYVHEKESPGFVFFIFLRSSIPCATGNGLAFCLAFLDNARECLQEDTA
jgi:hypothetical protein